MKSFRQYCLVSCLLLGVLSTAQSQATGSADGQTQPSQSAPQSDKAGDTPKTSQSRSAASAGVQDNSTAPSSSAASGRQTADTPPPPQRQTGETAQPLGTAAAENLTTGVAVSKPAGIALAPKKQPRARSILLKVGVIAGVAAAVGTTVALTAASSSKPPGSH